MSDRDDTTGESDPTGSTDHGTESESTEKAGGLGSEGTIPPDADGIAAGMGDESSNFNPEEDPEADSNAEDAGN